MYIQPTKKGGRGGGGEGDMPTHSEVIYCTEKTNEMSNRNKNILNYISEVLKEIWKVIIILIKAKRFFKNKTIQVIIINFNIFA